MIKAMRECLKNWLIQHERLYWYIVIGLAVFGFGLVTMLGLAKLEKANATEVSAEDIINSADYQAIMKYRVEEDYPYYSVVDLVANDGSHQLFLFQNNNGEPLVHLTPQSVNGYYDNALRMGCAYGGTGWYNYASSFNGTAKLRSWNFMTCVWAENVPLYVVEGNMDIGLETPCVVSDLTGSYKYTTTLYDIRPVPKVFSMSAPYVEFDSLNVRNDMAINNGYLFIEDDLYADFIKTAYWQYNGVMQNADAVADMGYQLEVDFVVELPTDAYIESLYDTAGVSMAKESNILKYASKAVSAWYGNDNAPKRTYKFTYLFDVMLNENGQFSYKLSFEEILTLIKYFNNETIEMFNGYDKDYMALLLSFMHIDRVDTVVWTNRSDCKMYGAITTNQFERGVFDASFEVISLMDREKVDADELESGIQWDLDEQYNSYVKDLEDKLNDMQNQIDQMGAVDGVFSGDLDTSDLWTSFRSIITGFASFIPSITVISLLAGSVFAFLPSAISGIIMATVLAVCIIAIIKAIK